jgi:hypothetical protein
MDRSFMGDPFAERCAQLAKAAIIRRDEAIRRILDARLGPGGWDMGQVATKGEIQSFPDGTNLVRWDGRTIGVFYD